MNRQKAKELAPTIKAFGDGLDVDYQEGWTGSWIKCGDTAPFENEFFHFRVRPEPGIEDLTVQVRDRDNFINRLVREMTELNPIVAQRLSREREKLFPAGERK